MLGKNLHHYLWFIPTGSKANIFYPKPVPNKIFLYKDKSGRGIVVEDMPLFQIMEWENEESYNGLALHEWVLDEAEVGDTWENSTIELTCTERL